MEIWNYISKKSVATFKKVPKHIWILFLIMAVGIFLRTYNFHDWMYFYPDQARDAILVEGVIKGESSWPVLGPIAARTPFQIGPMYYYFQIISAKIFGTGPVKMALPDLFFSILSIPLFYFFLRKLFDKNLSLAVTSLYSISFFVVKYSRFAWNPNPIPFFVILFLIALTEFLCKKNEIRYGWIIAIGVTLGVGVQLHTILLFLLPIILFLVCIFLIMKDFKLWKKIIIILIIAIIFNFSQITNEFKTDFANSKKLFNLSSGASRHSSRMIVKSLELSVLCQIQSNIHILSSLGNQRNCDYLKVLTYPKKMNDKENRYYIGITLSVLFSFFGYVLMIYYFWKNKNKNKKYFIGLIIVFASLSFFIMFPVIDGISLRYFMHLIFMPFLLLAFILNFLCDKFFKHTKIILFGVIIIFSGTNFLTIHSEVKEHLSLSRGRSNYVVLGEIELMKEYIIKQANPRKEAYFLGGREYVQNYFKPLSYLLEKENFKLNKVISEKDVPIGEIFFFITDFKKIPINKEGLSSYKDFGEIGIYLVEIIN